MLYKILFSITLSLIFVIHSIGAQTLKYMMWDPSQLEVEKETIAAFENSNPGLKIEVNAMPPKSTGPEFPLWLQQETYLMFLQCLQDTSKAGKQMANFMI